MIETILASLAPVFLVMILGYVAGKTKDIDNRNIDALNALVMDFALPAALFTAMAQTPRMAMIAQADVALALLLAMVIVYAAAYFVERRLFGRDRRESALLALTASGPNVGSAGMPLIAAIFSRSASVSVAVAVALAAVVLTPLSLLLLASAGTGGQSAVGIVRGALVKPIVIAPVLGLLLSLAGLSLPPALETTLSLVGQGASGAALFLTGLVLSAQPVRLGPNVAFGVAMKNVVQPALAGLFAFWLLSGEEARIVVLLAAVPSGAFGVLFAVRSEAPSDLIGTTLIVSTVASAVTLTAAILLSAAIWS